MGNKSGKVIDSEKKDPYSDSLSVFRIEDSEFNKIRELVHDYFGINLSNEKRMLVVGRLQRYLRENNFASFDEYIKYLESDHTRKAFSDLINRISTNYTYFFREQEHFKFLKKVALPQITEKLIHEKNKDLRIWSAGCSAGDEAYSLVITIKEFLGTDYYNWDAGILATDISETVLDEGRKGEYSKKRLGELDVDMVNKYFTEKKSSFYQVKPEINKEVTFRRFNLVNDKFPFQKRFEIILCRNVMIYFDSQTRERLVRKFYDLTNDGGYLFIGHSESLNKTKSPYIFVQPGIYRKGGGNG